MFEELKKNLQYFISCFVSQKIKKIIFIFI